MHAHILPLKQKMTDHHLLAEAFILLSILAVNVNSLDPHGKYMSNKLGSNN